MSTGLPETLIQTLLFPLTALLKDAANGDATIAQADALKAVNAYAPQTVIEYRLAVRIELFNIRALHAIGQAASQDLLPQVAARNTTNALSLTREADKAERRLEKLQAARRQAQPEAQVQTPQEIQPPAPDPDPEPETPARDPKRIAEEINQITAHAKATGQSFVQAYKQRKLEKRLAKRQEREARLQTSTRQEPETTEPA